VDTVDRVQVVDTTSSDGRDLQETGSNPPTVPAQVKRQVMSLVSAAWTHKLKQESIYSPGSLQERQEQAQEKTLEEEAVERTLEEEAV
jgi:hypothetical protein